MLSIWQLLDWSSYLKLQLAYGIACSQLFKSRKKFASPNFIGLMAIVFKLETPSAIKTIAHKDEEIIYLYIDAWRGKQKHKKIFVNSDAVVELFGQKMVYNLDILIHRMDEKWILQVPDNGYAITQEYV